MFLNKFFWTFYLSIQNFFFSSIYDLVLAKWATMSTFSKISYFYFTFSIESCNVGIRWEMTELQLFEVDGVSKVHLEKSWSTVFWMFPGKTTSNNTSFPTSFLNNNYHINNHNIAILYFIFVVIRSDAKTRQI